MIFCVLMEIYAAFYKTIIEMTKKKEMIILFYIQS